MANLHYWLVWKWAVRSNEAALRRMHLIEMVNVNKLCLFVLSSYCCWFYYSSHFCSIDQYTQYILKQQRKKKNQEKYHFDLDEYNSFDVGHACMHVDELWASHIKRQKRNWIASTHTQYTLKANNIKYLCAMFHWKNQSYYAISRN